MNKQIYIVSLPILLVLSIVLAYFKINQFDGIKNKFKEEYEKLNNEYYKVDIDKSSDIKYSNYEEIFDVLKSKTGIIYFGYSADNNSRYAIDTLLRVVKEKEVDVDIYYLDIHDDRDSYTIIDEKIVKEKDGSKNYYKLLEVLDEYLNDYVIYLDEIKYEVGEKRIHFPSIIFVKDGKIIDIVYVSTEMNYDDLYSIYSDYLIDLLSDSCSVNNGATC